MFSSGGMNRCSEFWCAGKLVSDSAAVHIGSVVEANVFWPQRLQSRHVRIERNQSNFGKQSGAEKSAIEEGPLGGHARESLGRMRSVGLAARLFSRVAR